MMDIIGESADASRIEDVAARLFVSPRTLQRVAKKYIGLSPSALMRRSRLQAAVEQARTNKPGHGPRGDRCRAGVRRSSCPSNERLPKDPRLHSRQLSPFVGPGNTAA
jgi:hypothetical protein